ncbi:ABC transporter ATP-binding protein [Clostridiaceae bacterium UIB06]|uniref:ABC transporter ATP-binding protein n=1 Tax=Clostridium thailandense TaxID=2794346 RepID=A0A949TY46_9CLOT|nr:ABC transporter ATP-binding protein [Clostridium thailandense]MBV7273715.1 ABC transporter ATP-binding protein [Clostridium thailandense]MCH5137505.1 ABC transporter ATP-binding protein [Clostridiaceae bacterium UIB06]
MILEIDKVSCGYGLKTIVKDISVKVQSGEVLTLLGPNGVGKTTFFKTILGFLKLHGGEIKLDGQNIKYWKKSKLAKAIGYVPQAHIPPFPFTVLDVVVMGRTAHLGIFASPSRKDIRIAEEALEALDVAYLKEKTYTEISGGERQMVLVARALTQEPEILVMDEPTSNLDFGNQVKVLKQINRLSKNGLGIIMTSHFPDHAFLCSTKVALLEKNNIFTVGSVDEVITEDKLRAAYGVNVKIISSINNENILIKSCVPVLD